MILSLDFPDTAFALSTFFPCMIALSADSMIVLDRVHTRALVLELALISVFEAVFEPGSVAP